MVEVLRNYDVALDVKRAQEGLAEAASLEDYQRKKNELVSYNKDQMVTNLSERYNVILSTYSYDVRDGELWGKDMGEPFMQSLKRGRDYRREYGSSIDYRREDAEVIGFKKIQDVMTDEDTPIGTMMLSVSPPGLEGSTYSHNFIDIHTKKIQESGEVYVESQRVSSGLSIEEYGEKISAFAEIAIDFDDPGAYFLENPIAIENTLTPDDLKFYLYKEHEHMDEETFTLIKENVSCLIERYAEAVVERPDFTQEHRILYNAVLNKADVIARGIQGDGLENFRASINFYDDYDEQQDIEYYGYQEVKVVSAGCGLSGGYNVSREASSSPFSVIEFGVGSDKYGERNFKCPSCRKENKRPYNKLLDRCQYCKSTKVAC